MFTLARLAVGLGPLNAPGAACTVRPDPVPIYRFWKIGSPAGLIPIRPFSRQRTEAREKWKSPKKSRGEHLFLSRIAVQTRLIDHRINGINAAFTRSLYAAY